MAAMEKAYGTQSELMRELRDAVTVTDEGSRRADREARQREGRRVGRPHEETIADRQGEPG